jgi:hypothetical protein
MPVKLTTTMIVLSLIAFAVPGFAYQEIEVKNAGSVRGKATLAGEVPAPRVYHLVLFPNREICAETDSDGDSNRVLEDFVADAGGGLKDVVVSIEHVDAGKPFSNKTIELVSEHCKFQPAVNVFRQGQGFTVDNKDAVMHNSQVYQSERGKIALNIPIPAVDTSKGALNFQKDLKIMQMICGMHEFMQTWGFLVQNPYHTITKEDGSFVIDNLPPGDYVITAWHFLMKIKSEKIHVAEGGVVDINFIFEGNEVVRPLYETIRSGRIKNESRPMK